MTNLKSISPIQYSLFYKIARFKHRCFMTLLPSLNEALQKNLAEYITANKTEKSDSNFFRAKRELAIARYALEQQSQIYHRLLTSLKELQVTENQLDVLSKLINLIEEKSTKLITSVNIIVRALKTAQDIETALQTKLDPEQAYSIIAQIPLLLENILLRVTNDPVLSNEVVMRLNDEIANLNIIVSNKEQSSAPQAIIEEQVISMINSGPGLTYHD